MRKPELIPFNKITNEAMKIAVAWVEDFRRIGGIEIQQKHKLASDIMNYAEIAAPVKVTRVEVIDDEGRQFVNWDKKNKVELSYQDDGRTLKIFITKK
jgi:hypothetical protein